VVERDADTLCALVDALARQFEAAGQPTERFETHISIVLLAGDFAYKFKKPVDFGFLDFSTLARRAHFCALELTLNRRHAPALYVDVLPVTDGPTLNGPGEPIEYALRMRRFATAERLDQLLLRGALARDELAAIAWALADTHAHAGPAPASSIFGAPTLVRRQMLDGLAVLLDALPNGEGFVSALEALCISHVAALEDRLQRGHVRDCHGDLHLSNIVRFEGRWLPFDCIEFSDELRYIDTASDVAFLLMDLDVRGHDADANWLLNEYLTASGDFGALSVLNLYCVYRSVVRAKVARLQQGAMPEPESEAGCKVRAHIALARRYLARTLPPALYITHGVSGSGKSWLAARIASARGFVHVRSDYERRRLAGLALNAESHSRIDDDLYATASTDATYERLAQIAMTTLRAGYTALIDASFLRARHRSALEAVARECGAHFGILDCDAPEAVLRERIVARHKAGRDPSEATLEVLDYQLRTRDALTARERAHALTATTLDDASIAALPGCCRVPAA
jgi:uncharacterized protein